MADAHGLLVVEREAGVVIRAISSAGLRHGGAIVAAQSREIQLARRDFGVVFETGGQK